MDEELQQLEAELKRLRPLAPARDVADGIARELAAAPQPRRNFWAWTALPLAAMAAGFMLLQERPAAPVSIIASTPPTAQPAAPSPANVAVNPPAAYKPVSAENLLYAQSDDGLVTLADGSTARRTRSSYVDTITWKNPRTQASLKWTVPRTDERVVLVSFQ
jgi:hypothetical protein